MIAEPQSLFLYFSPGQAWPCALQLKGPKTWQAGPSGHLLWAWAGSWPPPILPTVFIGQRALNGTVLQLAVSNKSFRDLKKIKRHSELGIR